MTTQKSTIYADGVPCPEHGLDSMARTVLANVSRCMGCAGFRPRRPEESKEDYEAAARAYLASS